MASFRPVNTALAPDSHVRNGEETTPTTPRPNTAPSTQPPAMHRDDATTPTRANFGALASQRPLPASPFPSAINVPENEESAKQNLRRGDSQYSAKSRDSEDVEMGRDSDNEGEEGSDDESVNADGTKSSKKKKSQRFYCTDYPPCSLSFTRSEHLARHIRKHTGERPFQCHCSRRFSRLDNLRQHAQTVHLNEEIPQDSLAATGTRFQRQVRTDRVRPPGRSRASTTSSQTSQGRGHTRNSLSASSIGSVASAYSARDDPRRRPPPLVMAGEPRTQRFSQEMYRPESPPSQYQYRPHSPGGYSTPPSATFSTGQNSPRWGSGMQSPISSHSRTASLYADHRTPGRRLSVPSAGNPFQSPHGNSFGSSMLTPLNASNMGAFSPSSSMMASPTTSTSGSIFSRRESISNVADDAWRRRTWHPDTSTGFTSRLQMVTTPNYYSNGPPPQATAVLPSNAPPIQMRLPGIESFDPLPPRSITPVQRQPSPMMIDTPSRVPPRPVEQYQQERPNSQHWDMGINRNLNRLDIQGTPPTDAAGSWANEANRAVQAQAEQARAQPTVRFEESPYSARTQTNGSYHQHTISAPPITPKESKRHGWYHGPVSVQNAAGQRTSPADSSGSEGIVPNTPNSNVRELNPAIVHSNGWIENRNGPVPVHDHQQLANPYAQYSQQNHQEGAYTYAPATQRQVQAPQHQAPKSTNNDLSGLDALLVAAGASDGKTATSIY
ncbi:hypothetical protein B0J14DRAFT_335149 [Halenospora varia]|nr:hypothetical protein B0J14DRAFT_335149 [Halenospora varia]